MFTYTIKRLLQSLIVVWAAVTLMFALFFIIPGDPISLKSGEKALPQEILDNIERKMSGRKTSHFGFGQFDKQIADGGENAGVGCRIGAWCASDG